MHPLRGLNGVAARATDVVLGYGSHVAIRQSSFEVSFGELTAVIGPNGSGKSTLLNAIAGLIEPMSGTIEVTVPRKRISYVMQSTKVPEALPVSVGEVVTMGRYATTGPYRRLGHDDRAAIDEAMERLAITDLAPRLQGEVWIGVYIGNYDKGGHTASLSFKYYPGYGDGSTTENKKWVMPVFNSTNLMEMAGQEYATLFGQDSLTVTVNIPEGVKNLKLRYITTGHGGWGGGDEFNPKLNEIFADGKRVYHFFPWREDCATYRLLNPASGNFGNGLSSSDLSRSNWCPGTLTLPVDIPLELTPGKHTLQVAIPLGKPEGGSFSFWNVSGVLIGDME